jgi:hypothetical protein
MTANPLVAGPVDTSSALGGTMLLESLGDLTSALESGSWLEIGLAAFSTAMDTVAAVMDPLGQLIAAGLGWLMEHLEPLKGWLNDLTGDAGAVAGFAATWDNIATQMTAAADELDRVVRADLEGMTGAAVVAYARYTKDLGAHVRGLSGSSSAVASSLRTCSTIVKVVHDLVRDALAELVGAAISWAAEIALTVGLGTPWVIGQVASRVSALATRVGTKVTEVITSARSLKQLIEALKEAIQALARNLRGAKPGGVHTPDAPKSPDLPPGHVPDGLTSPSRTPDPAATPGGRPTIIGPKEDPDTVRSLTRENESAQTLAQHGYDVEQNPSVPGDKNPDYRIEGEVFDNVAPVTGNVRNIWSRVEEKVLQGQTERVVLNLDDTPVSMDALRAQFTYEIPGLKEVIIVRGGDVVRLFP